MSQALTIFSKMQLPAQLADMFGDETNIRDRQTTPTLSYEGKVWQIALNGERTKITRKDSDGEIVPASVMRVVILGVAERRGRAYYEGAYDPAKPGAPLCWSDDGVVPDKSVAEPKGSKCDTCPMSAKGSKITEQNKAVTACSQHLMLAVVPANNLEFTPLRLKLAITSVWDAQSPELAAEGWFAFDNYREFLRTNGVKHTAMLVTKMKFDPNTAYPKVLFSPDRWLEADEGATVKPLLKAESVTSLLGGTWTPAGADGVPKVQIAAAKAESIARAEAGAVVDDEDEPPVKTPPKATKPKAEAKAKPAPVIDADDEDGETMVLDTKPKADAKPAPKVTTEVGDDVKDLLSEWGEDE